MKLPKIAVGSSLILFLVAVLALVVLGLSEQDGPEPQPMAESMPTAQDTDGEESPATEPSRPEIPTFTLEEVARHDHVDDCWLIIRGRVYDVTEYIPRHPADLRTITDYCGGESTEAFETKEHLERDHRRSSYRLLENYFVGRVEREE